MIPQLAGILNIQKIISDNKNEFIKDKGLEDDLFEIIIVNSKKNTDLVLVHDGWALAKLYTTLTNSNMDDDAFNKTDILDKQEIINLFNTNADGTKSNRCIQFVKYDDLPLKEQQKDQPAVNMISALYSPALYSPALYSPTKEGGKKKRNKSHKKTAKKHKRKRTHSRRKKL